MSQTAKNLPPDVRLVESDREFFAKSGPLPVHWKDIRKFPRFYLRSRTEAIVYPLKAQTSTSPRTCKVVTSDISRGGMNLMTGQQVFPGQRIDLRLTTGQIRTLKVAWCRRVSDRCYSVGTQFVS